MSSDTRVSRDEHKEYRFLSDRRQQGRGRGRGRGGQGGPAPGGGRGGHANRSDDKPRREAILDLAKYTDKKICVKFTGGRQGETVHDGSSLVDLRFLTGCSLFLVTGTLKGYDQLLNLVMDDLEETLNGEQEPVHCHLPREPLIVGSNCRSRDRPAGCAASDTFAGARGHPWYQSGANQPARRVRPMSVPLSNDATTKSSPCRRSAEIANPFQTSA